MILINNAIVVAACCVFQYLSKGLIYLRTGNVLLGCADTDRANCLYDRWSHTGSRGNLTVRTPENIETGLILDL